MTTKPSLIGSLIVMAVALLLGLASGVLVSRMTHREGQGVAAHANDMSEPAGEPRSTTPTTQ